MGRILFFLIAFIAVVIAVLLVAPGVVPVATYKSQVETRASEALGREVTIGDDLSIKFFPRAAFVVNDLTIADANGFDGPYLASVEKADIGIRLMSFFSGAVEVNRFVLTNPDIRLIRARDGKVNWNLADGADAPQETEAQSAGAPSRDVKLGTVSIDGGAAQFEDQAAGKTYTATDMDLAIVLTSLSAPLEVSGSLTFQGEPSQIDLVLTSLADIMAAEPANMKLDLTVGDTEAGADLTVETENDLRYSGPVRLNAPDLPAFAALTGTQLADAPGFDNLAVDGVVDGGGDALRLSEANIEFDDIDAQGALTLNWSGARPKASGVLSTDRLDLRPYMPPPAENPQGFPAWSETPMNFSSLRNVDADFDISTGAIFINDLTLGESRLKLRIDNGRMVADIPELAMYGGQGSGQMVVNARGATPSFAGNFDMGSVNAQPLSTDLFKHDNLLGLGSFKLNFTATGDSQAEIMSSMDGAGGFDIADGALKGINIAGIVRAVNEFQSGFNPAALANAVAEARGPAQETDFSEFLSNFQITDGLVDAPTIQLTGAFVSMTGNGTVNLPLQQIDLRLLPRGTSKAFGEGGRSIAVPMRIGGTFSQPTVAIDTEALVRSGAEQQLRGLLEGALGNDEDEAASDGDNAAPEEETTPEDTARRAIEGILGGGRSEPEPGDEGASADEPSIEEELINTGLGAIFGGSRKEEAETKDSSDGE